MRSLRAAIVVPALVLAGCADDADDSPFFVVPTEVAVSPADFLGDLPCSTFEGAARSYVVTLYAYDDEKDATPFTVGSSLPAACSAVVGFRGVIVVGKRYTASVDVYDVPATELSPLGGTASGSRQMVHEGEPIAPRWTSSCGGSAEDAPVAELNKRVFVRPCDSLLSTGTSATALAVSAADVLGEAGCDLAASVDITFESGGLPDATGLACDGASIEYEAEPGREYVIYATALVDGTPRGTLCLAEGIEGVTVRPSCSALTAQGSATIALGGVGDPPICPSGSWFDLFVGETLVNSTPLPCGGTAAIGSLDPGIVTFDAVIYDDVGQIGGQATCAVEIEPGKTKAALCLAGT